MDSTRQVGPFAVGAALGRGGMGEVRAATLADRPLALKFLFGSQAHTEDARRAFEREVRAVAALDHPNVVRLFDYGTLTADIDTIPIGTPWFAMERASGSLQRKRPRVWEAARAVLHQLLDALAHAHARGVIHLDVKPANVLICGERDARGADQIRVVLTDFGIAHALERPGVPASGSSAGTPAYMAPEQWNGAWRRYGPWTDLYAVGHLAWAMCTGKAPFAGLPVVRAAGAHLMQTPGEFAPRLDVPDGLERWIRQLVAKDPADRFRCAADAARALRRIERDVDEPTLTATTRFGRSAAISLVFDLAHTVDHLPADWRRPSRRWSPPLRGAGLGLVGLRSAPLVGRADERDALWEMLRRVQAEERPAAVVLRGPAGCGKSRLAEWLARRTRELGGLSLRAVHAQQSGPMHGLGPMLDRHLRTIGLQSPALEERLGESLGPRTDTVVRLLRPTDRRLSAKDRLRAVIRVLGQTAGDPRRPVVLWLDDVVWSEEALDLVDHLLESRGLPVLAVCTVREESLGEPGVPVGRLDTLEAHARAGSIRVEPLPIADRRRLLRDALGLEPQLASVVEARAGGNPLFAIQLVDDWAARDLLIAGPAGLSLIDGADRELPKDLAEIWDTRVARFLTARSPGEQLALEVAAALGDRFDLDEWRAACTQCAADPSAKMLAALLDARLLRSESAGSQAAYAFVHGMLREAVARVARSRGRWARVHTACAEVLERSTDRASRGRLGRHLLHAGALEAALEPLADGAHAAYLAGTWAACEALIDDRSRALDRLGATADDVRRARGWEVSSMVRISRGALVEGRALAERAARVAAAADDRWLTARALRQAGDASMGLSEWDRAESLFARAIDVARLAGDPVLEAWCHSARGWALLNRGDTADAEAPIRAAEAVFRATDTPLGMAACAHALANWARAEGQSSTVVRGHLEAAVHAARRGGQASRVGDALNTLAELSKLDDDFEDAERLYRESLQILDDLGHVLAWMPKLNLALMLLEIGRPAEALEGVTEAVAELAETELVYAHGAAFAGRLACLAALGEWPELERAWREQGAVLRHAAAHTKEVDALMARARSDASAAGRIELAARLVRPSPEVRS